MLFATSCRSCYSHGPPGWSRGVKMASQGAPEVPKLLPKVLPKCQNRFLSCSRDAKMESQNAKKKPPSCPNSNWTEKKTWYVEMGARLLSRCWIANVSQVEPQKLFRCRNGKRLNKTKRNDRIKNSRLLTIPNIASFPKQFSRQKIMTN